MGEHLGDVFVTDQLVADSGSMGRGHDQVHIADRVTAAAIGTGDHDTTAAAEKTHQCFRFGFRDGDPEALFGHGLFQRRRKLLFNRRAKSFNPVQPSCLDDPAQIVEGVHLQSVVKEFEALWPKSRQGGHFAKFAGQLLLQRVQQREMPCLDDFGNFAS